MTILHRILYDPSPEPPGIAASKETDECVTVCPLSHPLGVGVEGRGREVVSGLAAVCTNTLQT